MIITLSYRLKPVVHAVAFSVLTACMLPACKKNDLNENQSGKIALTPAEYLSIATDKPRDIGESKVKEVVRNFMGNQKVKSASGKSISIEKKSFASLVKNVVSSQQQDENSIPLYTVTIGDKRSKETAIVSGDDRLPVVLAYYTADTAETHTGTAYIGRDLMLEAAEATLKHRINRLDRIKDSLRTLTVKKVSGLLSIPERDFRFENYKDRITMISAPTTKATIIADPSTTGTVVGQYGPLIYANWSAGMPYNRQMAQSCPNNWLWDNRYAISSVAIATAHILSSYQPAMSAYGTTIDWAYLQQNSDEIYETSDYFGGWVADPLPRRDMVAYLMKYIGEQCGISYTCTSSTVNFSNVSSFLNRYRIRVGARQNLNTNVLKQSVQTLKPAYMYGQTSSLQGHWWVVDGVMLIEVGSQPTYNSYVHANMGQGRSYTGYYLIGSDGSLTFDASFAHFNTNLAMYPNVEMY